jgi:hypothetical protein
MDGSIQVLSVEVVMMYIYCFAVYSSILLMHDLLNRRYWRVATKWKHENYRSEEEYI